MNYDELQELKRLLEEKRRLLLEKQGLSDDGAKVLRIDSHAKSERDKAFVTSMSSTSREYREALERRRQERYEAMIEESELVESPMSRRGGR